MMKANVGLLFRTIRYLKPIQIFYQVKLRLNSRRSLAYYKVSDLKSFNVINLRTLPQKKTSVTPDLEFTFLNLSKKFKGKVDWNFMDYGKLWNYNLQYLDFINEATLPLDTRIEWVNSLYKDLSEGILSLEPYPASLRIINVIRFIQNKSLSESEVYQININLFAECQYLNENYEFHLLGNHVLENAFAMLMAGCFYNETSWKKKAVSILERELNEQILEDGAHFELSPMYHQIILYRLLEVISYFNEPGSLKDLLKKKVSLMLSWLEKMTFKNGDIPHFNDSTNGITYSTEQLFQIAEKLGVKKGNINLSDSGYRKFTTGKYELVVDTHGISPGYQPGHAHADHGSFVLYSNGLPLIVDPGISTYNISPLRQWERSSVAHNTVTVKDKDQTEVWSGFRVGRRAQVEIQIDNYSEIEQTINYELEFGKVIHKRKMDCFETSIKIVDTVSVGDLACARFYFAPGINPIVESNRLLIKSDILITIEQCETIRLKSYNFAAGFNLLQEASVAEIFFYKNLHAEINFND